MAYWLMKSEPGTYSIDDLERERSTGWDGVRNYQVRNMMRDEMRKGDQAFFYHSSCAEPGVVGIMTVRGGGRPDPAQFDPESPYCDPKSDPDNPTWLLVEVAFKRKLSRTITLAELRGQPGLDDFQLLRRGNRLSVVPVTPAQWELILSLE
ncbi:MAG: EVE domain-containing protein [Chromatiales bacterium]|nr:EVE domain-containing protein [Chromatiales bacterium]